MLSKLIALQSWREHAIALNIPVSESTLTKWVSE